MKQGKSSFADRCHKRRGSVVREIQRKHSVDFAWITNRSDIRYLSGGSEGVIGLLIGPQVAVAVTAKMFEHVLPGQVPGCEVRVGSPFKVIGDVLREQKYRRGLGVQGQKVTWSLYRKLDEAMGRRKLVDIANTLAVARAVKDEEEIRLIRRCVQLAQGGYRELLAQGARHLLKHTERELAAELEYRMRMLGADKQAFPGGIIVASGPNSASCHHEPTGRKVRRGEALLFDWGAEYAGYRSDITRTVFVGAPSDKMRHVYETVQEANAAGVAAVRSGATSRRVADAGWNVVRDKGYGDLIRHGLGHGVGLDVHEEPGIGAGGSQPSSGDTKLRKGMVVTIEPGVYLDGIGGVRIEDDVVVMPGNKSKCLTSLPRSLQKAVLPV